MNILEQGQIQLFCRHIETHQPEGTQATQRVYMILHPRGEKKYRLIIFGRIKTTERMESGRDKYWGFVGRVVFDSNLLEQELLKEYPYRTGTSGDRTQQAARPAGKGVYAILDHHSHVHLAYVLELPRSTGPVQENVRIELEANYIITIKSPGMPGLPGAVSEPQDACFSKLSEREFAGKRFITPHPESLDYEGAEIVLISGAEDVKEELGVELDVEDESAQLAAIFKNLRVERGASA
jgi:hypothetical protein